MSAQLSDDIGYLLSDNIGLLETSPIALFSMVAYAIQTKHHKFVNGISPSENTIYKPDIEENYYINKDLIKNISIELRNKNTDGLTNFANLKYYLDTVFFELTLQGTLEYLYKKEYMLSSKDLCDALKISRSTLFRYKDLGLESVEGFGHKTYPCHNVYYWNNSLWSSRIQSLYQCNKIRNRTDLDIILELVAKVNYYKERYGGPFSMVFKDIIDGNMDVYDLDEPGEYYDWKDSLEELEELQSKSE